MELSEFEKLAKEKLTAREIEGSADSWKRLSKQLEKENLMDKSNPIFSIRNISVAATILVLIAIGAGVFLKTEDTTQQSDQVDFVFDESTLKNPMPNKSIRKSLTSQNTEAIGDSEKTKDVIEAKEDAKESMYKQNSVADASTSSQDRFNTKAPLNSRKVVSDKTLESDMVVTTLQTAQTSSINDLKIIESISTEALDTKPSPTETSQSMARQDTLLFSDAEKEAETLLAEAQTQLINADTSTSTLDVNPVVMLEEAESDLDQTFKEQVLEAIIKSYKKVRTAMKE